MTGRPRRMHARVDSLCPQCRTPIRVGDWIFRFEGGKFFICQRCAEERSAKAGHTAAPAGRGETWADHMYTALGPELGDLAHKALTPVLHPDIGGDHTAMAALNRARDRAHGKNTKGQAA